MTTDFAPSAERLTPTAFSLVGLHLLDIGPLRGLTSQSFVNGAGVPNDLYLMMGPNGAGKTTILESIFLAMSLLGQTIQDSYGHPALDEGNGGIQLDARIVLDDGQRARPYLLSIVVGDPGILSPPDDADLARAEADEHVTLHFRRQADSGLVRPTSQSDRLARQFHEAVIAHVGEPTVDLFDSVAGFPTVLYFPSNRGIGKPPTEMGVMKPPTLTYLPARRFDTDGGDWSASLDNLFVWFGWIDRKLEERCRSLVSRLVFRDRKRLLPIDRQNLFVPVEIQEDGTRHRLHQLSSGERQLVQLVVRIASHMSGSTIVLIDEVEQHLHTVLQRRLAGIIKDWAREHESLSFFMTSHQKEIFRFINPFLDEPGLSKGAALVKPRYRVKR